MQVFQSICYELDCSLQRGVSGYFQILYVQKKASQLPSFLASVKMSQKQPGNYVGLGSSCETPRNVHKTLSRKMLFTAE